VTAEVKGTVEYADGVWEGSLAEIETADAAIRHDASERVVDRLSRPNPFRAVGDTLGELTTFGKAEGQLGAGKHGGKTIEIILARSSLVGVHNVAKAGARPLIVAQNTVSLAQAIRRLGLHGTIPKRLTDRDPASSVCHGLVVVPHDPAGIRQAGAELTQPTLVGKAFGKAFGLPQNRHDPVIGAERYARPVDREVYIDGLLVSVTTRRALLEHVEGMLIARDSLLMGTPLQHVVSCMLPILKRSPSVSSAFKMYG
jgi:hypothetical protein